MVILRTMRRKERKVKGEKLGWPRIFEEYPVRNLDLDKRKEKRETRSSQTAISGDFVWHEGPL